MKTCFLDALSKISEVNYFTNTPVKVGEILKELPGFFGAGIRLYSETNADHWEIPWTTGISSETLGEILDWSNKFNIDDDSLIKMLSCKPEKNGKRYKIAFSPYFKNKMHLGDFFLVFEADTMESLMEWSLFCDFVTTTLLSKCMFSSRLISYLREDPAKILNFIHDTQKLLNQRRNTSALFLEADSSKRQADIWAEEDEPIIMKFLCRFQAEFGLHTVFIIQEAAPRYKNSFVVTSVNPEDELPDEIVEMIDAPTISDANEENIITRSIIKNGKDDFVGGDLSPLIFTCRAGNNTFGHLGLFTNNHHMQHYMHHQTKLISMLANQLGFFFSHFYQLRKEALHGRKLQQINQACNIVNSSVEIGAILFHLIRSLNNLFGQYSGAILIYSKQSHHFEIVSFLGAPVPEGIRLEEDVLSSSIISEVLNDGSAFDNTSGKYATPIRYVLPMASAFQTPSHDLIKEMMDKGKDPSDIFQGRPSLGSVILFDSDRNRHLTSAELDKLLPILLNGMGSSLQVARNYEEKLETIKALENLISRMSNEEALLDEMILIIRRLLNVTRISFLTFSQDREYLYIKKGFGLPEGVIENTKIQVGTEISGFVVEQGRSYRVDNIENDIHFKKRSLERYMNSSLLSVPLISHAGGRAQVMGVINVNNKINNLTFTDQDQQLLEAISNLVATAFDNVRLMAEEKERELMNRQLNDAKTIQMSLLPKNFDEFPPSLEIFGQSIPARQIGGDFFDILPLDDGRTLIALGDVSGKGMPAAILMAVSRMILRYVVQETSDVVEILERVNKKLSTELDDYHFVTFQVVSIDPITGDATMSSAGHGPLMVRLDGHVTMIETNSGPPLGISGIEGAYDKMDFVMKPGDVFVSYTDGLSEEYSPSKEMYGTERIEKFINENAKLTSKQQVEKLIDSAIKWRARAEAHDDLTVLMLKFKG